MLRDSLKEGEVVRDFTCGDIARADKTNVIADLAEEVSGLLRSEQNRNFWAASIENRLDSLWNLASCLCRSHSQSDLFMLLTGFYSSSGIVYRWQALML